MNETRDTRNEKSDWATRSVLFLRNETVSVCCVIPPIPVEFRQSCVFSCSGNRVASSLLASGESN